MSDFERISADRRRTIRQAQALTGGTHPLSLTLGRHIRLHPDAPPAADRDAPGPRCGSCWYRHVLLHHDTSFPKCTLEESRLTHGAGTDVRAWWPACVDYSAGDPALSADAARWTPGQDGR